MLVRCVEGESKIIYSVLCSDAFVADMFDKYLIILLKSTVYSHRKQHTGEIKDLGKVRAYGSMLFLEMIRRNQLNHAYVCLNSLGIIISRKVFPNKLEIIFKTQCIGTDKHIYHGI